MTATLLIDGKPVPVELRRSLRAVRLSLRVDGRDGSIVLVLPRHVSTQQGLSFAQSQARWLADRVAALPERIAFAEGNSLPLLGRPHRLCHDPSARRGVWADNDVLFVSGRTDHFSRRVGDWLKTRAKAEISARATPMAATIGRTLRGIRLADTRSRWGSCSSRGILAFSWRLVMAPAEVLTYVVAHEVAHLAEMNHSSAFWQVVESLTPNADTARKWLKNNGTQLHRYG